MKRAINEYERVHVPIPCRPPSFMPDRLSRVDEPPQSSRVSLRPRCSILEFDPPVDAVDGIAHVRYARREFVLVPLLVHGRRIEPLLEPLPESLLTHCHSTS